MGYNNGRLKPDAFKDKRNEGAYDAFDSDVSHVSWHGNSEIYCVAKKFGNLYWEMGFNQSCNVQPSSLNHFH